MTFLLDTNVVSELRRRRPDPAVLAWMGKVSSAEIFISSLTIGEIRLGIERLRTKDGAQADLIDQWLTGLRTAYADRVLDIDSPIAEEWGRMNAPRPLPVIDGLIAATARVHRLILVTRNTADLAGSDVAMVNPFEPSADR